MERAYAARTVDEYLDAVPTAEREALAFVRRVILDAVPGCSEHIGYGVPIFEYRRRGLVGLSFAQGLCCLHLMSPPLARELKSQITEGDLVGSMLHFTAEDPLGADTVRLIVERRVAEVDTQH